MTAIHPTAIVDASAQLANDVEVGAYAIVEGDTTIGAGTVLRPHAIVRRHTVLGEGNVVDSFVVLGSDPQDYKFDPGQVTSLQIGDRNTFREGVTISRATGDGEATVVGNETYWMSNSHAGHNARVGDNVVLANCTLLAGHVTVGKGVVFAGGCLVHQFCWIGDRTMFQGQAGVSMHVPPYVILTRGNEISSLNSVGLRRAPDLTGEDRAQIKQAFRLTYRAGLTPPNALAEMDTHDDWGAPASAFREFVRRVLDAEPPYNRGLVSMMSAAARGRGHRGP